MDIIGKKNIFFAFSSLLVLTSIFLLFTFGLKPGIDFTGGSLMEISFSGERPGQVEVQEVLDTFDIGAQVQAAGEHGYILKMRFITEDEHQEILGALRESFETTESEDSRDAQIVAKDGEEVAVAESNRLLEERVETIGPAISAHLRSRAWKAGVAVVIAIILYIAYAFRKVSKPVQSWKFGVSAIIALVHDVLIVMGVFALLGHLYGVEVDIPFVVALLTILGYSVNDTIVVFDRVRETLIAHRGKEFDFIVNTGVNGTLQRSFNTSITTLLVLSALFFFGGASIHYFSLALIIGIISGTYSSIFLASPLLSIWYRLKK